ncbi:MAG TPA: exodeoxyribonuclease VII large subunit [Pseudolabrys sp.]|nr:exodeoxyribonuclease VII large subunit [Pseudolabrys sp.]
MPVPVLNNLVEWTVSELSAALRRTVEDAYGYIRVRGEVSGFKGASPSGHVYFRLKDDKSVLEAVIWKGTFGRMRVKPEEGLDVVVCGKLTTFPGSSKYQIVIDTLEPAGIGALMKLLEERKRKLAAEGLFDETRKQLLPYLPDVIGVVTSPTGAVIRDILHRLQDRFPRRVLVWPVRVQGETSAAEVASAIQGFNALSGDGPVPRPDLIIVARGGGSLEDLWSFNEEAVVRAAAESIIPLISAVGHETDITLIDFAADRRAPTPTAAAEIAVPVRADLMSMLVDLGARKLSCWRRNIGHHRKELYLLSRSLPAIDDVLAGPRQRLDACVGRLPRALRANAQIHHTQLTRVSARLSPRLLSYRIDRCGEQTTGLGARARRAFQTMQDRRAQRIKSAGQLLTAYSYRGVLARGFALVRDAAGRPVRSAETVTAGMRLAIEFSDGQVEATATDDNQPPRPGTKTRTRTRGGGDQGGAGGQGSLFTA